MIRFAVLLIVVGIVLLWASLHATSRRPFDGVVTSVVDGDSIIVLRHITPTKIRLAGIDAPEHHQAYGQNAKLMLQGLVYRKPVYVVPTGAVSYDRIIAHVYVSGLDVSLAMVEAGLAWQYVQYSTDRTLRKAEDTARRQHFGLWADPQPIPPWQFRRHR